MTTVVVLETNENDNDNKVDSSSNEFSNMEAEIESNKPSQIINGIYLGTKNHAWDLELLKELNITHIVQCVSGSIGRFTNNSNIEYKIIRNMIPMCDRGTSSLNRKFDESFPFIVKALKNKENILIHCQSGVNRSCSVTVGFLMFHQQLTLKNAHAFVEDKHSRMCLHDKYMAQLREYDNQLFGKYSTKNGELMTTSIMLRNVRKQIREAMQAKANVVADENEK